MLSSAPCRRCQLNSNVRLHKMNTVALAPPSASPALALRSQRLNTGARKMTLRLAAPVKIEWTKPCNAPSAGACVNHLYLGRPGRLASAPSSLTQRNREAAPLAPNPLASRSVSGKNPSMSCLAQHQSNCSRLVRGTPVEPNPSFKLSPNGGSRWSSSAGPAAHFALAAQRAPPSVPA